jgi:hypothetical protein
MKLIKLYPEKMVKVNSVITFHMPLRVSFGPRFEELFILIPKWPSILRKEIKDKKKLIKFPFVKFQGCYWKFNRLTWLFTVPENTLAVYHKISQKI